MKCRLLFAMSFALLAACNEVTGPGSETPVGNTLPTVDFTADRLEGAAPLVVSFTTTAADPDGDSLRYALDFGDGQSLDTQNATHTYRQAGSYTASVTVDDGQGGIVSDALTIEVTGSGDGGSNDGDDDGDNGDGSTPETCTSPVEIPDEVLEKALRYALEKESGDLTCADMASLTEFGHAGAGGDDPIANPAIENITGLEHATSLRKLWLGENEISDLTPLQNLTALELLHLGSDGTTPFANNVSDVKPLRRLVNLRELNLQYLDVVNLQGLENLVKLEVLNVNGSDINDLAPLQRLTALKDIDFGDNNITSLTPLKNLVALEKLTLEMNQIGSLSGLENLTNLDTLYLGSNLVSDLTPLQDLLSLSNLSVGRNQLVDITPLQSLLTLTSLDLARNDISNLAPLQGLGNLEYLGLSDNAITDLTPLVNNPGIDSGDSLSVYENNLDTCPGSQDLADIQTLEARGVSVIYTECSP